MAAVSRVFEILLISFLSDLSFRENRFLIFLIFSLNDAVTLKSRSRSIKIGHGNTLILSYLLVKFGHETRKSGMKKERKRTSYL